MSLVLLSIILMISLVIITISSIGLYTSLQLKAGDTGKTYNIISNSILIVSSVIIIIIAIYLMYNHQPVRQIVRPISEPEIEPYIIPEEHKARYFKKGELFPDTIEDQFDYGGMTKEEYEDMTFARAKNTEEFLAKYPLNEPKPVAKEKRRVQIMPKEADIINPITINKIERNEIDYARYLTKEIKKLNRGIMETEKSSEELNNENMRLKKSLPSPEDKGYSDIINKIKLNNEKIGYNEEGIALATEYINKYMNKLEQIKVK